MSDITKLIGDRAAQVIKEEIQVLQERLSVAVNREVQSKEQNRVLHEIIDVRQKKKKIVSKQDEAKNKSNVHNKQ